MRWLGYDLRWYTYMTLPGYDLSDIQTDIGRSDNQYNNIVVELFRSQIHVRGIVIIHTARRWSQ